MPWDLLQIVNSGYSPQALKIAFTKPFSFISMQYSKPPINEMFEKNTALAPNSSTGVILYNFDCNTALKLMELLLPESQPLFT